jgi:hypothetical protein
MDGTSLSLEILNFSIRREAVAINYARLAVLLVKP